MFMSNTMRLYKPFAQVTLAAVGWVALAIGIWWSWINQQWWFLVLALTLGFVHNIVGQSIALHKFFTHRQFQVTKSAEWILALWSVLTGFPPTAYAAVHRQHHISADTDQDPHCPATITSFFRCLIGATASSVGDWPTLKSRIHDSEYHDPFGKVSQYFFAIWSVLLIMVGTFLGWQGIVFGLLIPAWYCQVPGGGVINAFGHWHGYRNFETGDRSTNSWIANLFTPGEGYQNNHHHDASQVNFAAKPDEFDLGYWLIKITGAIKAPRTNHVPND